MTESNTQLVHGIHLQPAEVDEDEQREREHFEGVVSAFAKYEDLVRRRVELAHRRFSFLPPFMKDKIPTFEGKLDRICVAAAANQRFLRDLVAPHLIFDNDHDHTLAVNPPQHDDHHHQHHHHHDHDSSHSHDHSHDHNHLEHHSHDGDHSHDHHSHRNPKVESDHEKVRSTLKQCVRDWSAEGEVERNETYVPLITEVQAHFPNPRAADGSPIKILVPGAGLGRLAFEFANRGYHCQGNEFSYYMLIASNYFLNRVETVNQFQIFPFVHQFSNVWEVADQLRGVMIPDIIPQGLPEGSDFSMTAGDFLEVYGGQRNTWDCVVTSFFLDTAKNVVAYIEVIQKILKPGGVWINTGPLLYHFEELEDEISIELSYEEVREVILRSGFEFKKEERRTATYVNNPKSMYVGVYNCCFFSATKLVVL